jgi:hypothetical protein
MLCEHLARAAEHVAAGENTLHRQRRVLRSLERDGHDTRAAKELLDRFEKLQALHIADRDRLRRELDLACYAGFTGAATVRPWGSQRR